MNKTLAAICGAAIAFAGLTLKNQNGQGANHGVETPPARTKTEGGLENNLQIQEAGRK